MNASRKAGGAKAPCRGALRKAALQVEVVAQSQTQPTTIEAWLQVNGRAPGLWQVIAERLIRYHDAKAMFRAFAVYGVDEVKLFAATCAAHDYAAEEMRRPLRKDEGKALDRVQRAIAGLRKAIGESPLPKNWAAGPYELCAEGKPTVLLRIGWRDLSDSASHAAFGYPLSVDEVLNIADTLLARHRERRPLRVGERRRDRPRERTFVRWLAHVLLDRFEKQPPAVGLAHVANAVLGLSAEAAVGDREVREMLGRVKGPRATR